MSQHTTTYSVTGMTCGHCTSAVGREVGAIDGVTDVQVDLATGAVTVTSTRPVPDGELAAAIDEQFGSFDGFQAQFTATATTIQGSGWAVLAWDALGRRLHIVQLYDQQGNVPIGLVPVVMLDMWEHAFYLQYKNVKPDYVKAWWNVVNWADAQARFDAARTQTGLIVPA